MKPLMLVILLISSITSFSQTKFELDSITIVLELVYKLDQEPRLALDSLGSKFGYVSVEMSEHWKKIGVTDSINIVTVTKIIDRYGWLSALETSDKANSSLFLVIQHSNLKTREKYLPILQKAVEIGKAKPRDFAYLVDRTLMDKGMFQSYGTQLNGAKKGELSFYPIADERNVNKRRKEIGLEPIEEYAKGLLPEDYVRPKRDLYKNKFVFAGSVADNKGGALSQAAIYLGNNVLIGTTDSTGHFRLVIDTKYRKWAFTIRKEGCQSMALAFDDEKDSYWMGYRLSKR